MMLFFHGGLFALFLPGLDYSDSFSCLYISPQAFRDRNNFSKGVARVNKNTLVLQRRSYQRYSSFCPSPKFYRLCSDELDFIIPPLATPLRQAKKASNGIVSLLVWISTEFPYLSIPLYEKYLESRTCYCPCFSLQSISSSSNHI